MSRLKKNFFAVFVPLCGQFLFFGIPHSTFGITNYPSWWTNRSVINTNATSTNDYAAVNAGQLKWFATNAYEELKANLPGGAGTNVENMIKSFSATNNYYVVNLGQLKNLAKPFYDRLIAESYTNSYPWTSTTTDDVDYAAANIGQVKNVFSFDITKDLDSDFLPDWWEVHWFGNTNSQSGSDDSDSDGFLNAYEYTYNSNPQDPLSVPSATYYVNDSTGNDTNSGLTAETAKKTIQAAINLCNNNYDIVQVADGTYSGASNRNLTCGNKKIMVRAENGPSNCTINCEGSATYADRRAFYFGCTDPNVGRLTVVDGFTIANGWYDYGGGIYCYSASPTIRNCVIENCRAYKFGGGGVSGAGIYWDGGAFNEERVIENCQIRKNRSDGDGGGIVIKGAAQSFIIANCTIESNSVASATGAGGGIYVHSSSGSISNCIVRKNIYSTDVPIYGGGIYCSGSGDLKIQDSLIEGNYARDNGGGGGIAAFNWYGDLVITNCAVINNLAAYLGSYGPGGGIYHYGPTWGLMIYDTQIKGNKGSDGGGVYIKNIGSDVDIKHCLIENNEATSDGGGIHFENSGGSVNACRFFDNIASARGGALHFENTSAPVIRNSLVSSNQAVNGGGLCATNSSPIIINCTITTNIATTHGGAVVSWANAVVGLTNCILWNNSEEIYLYAGTVTASYCDVKGGYAGTGNINTNPLLYVDGFHLSGTNSPCFNAGASVGVTSDIDGNSRPWGNAVDIGCHEYVDTDGDGMADWWEIQEYGSTNNAWDADPDNDGLNNWQEYNAGTDPLNPDMDGDGLPDGIDAYPLTYDATLPTFTITYPTNNMAIP